MTPTLGSLPEKPISAFNEKMNAKSANAMMIDRTTPNLVRKVFRLAI